MKPNVVLLIRVSSSKQASENNSDGQQLDHGIRFIEEQGWVLDKPMAFVESGRVPEREFFQEVIDYCIDPRNKISFLVARDISRFTRQGSVAYKQLKEKLSKAGVQLQDTYGTVKPKENSMKEYGVEYNWSSYYPSEAEELKQADQARDQARQSLTLMIGAEIEYERSGYWNRRPPYGFSNKKIQTKDEGRRNIIVEKKSESIFIKKLLKMRASGLYKDQEIVDEVNKLGYKSRKIHKRDKKTQKIVGYGGEKPLTVKQLQVYVKNPVYAGIVCTKWTHYKPVKGQFKGLVDIDIFNQANRGKVIITHTSDGIPNIRYGEEQSTDKVVKRRTKNNPKYPYKNIVLCPSCESPILGSASTGKSGKKYAAYHCSKKHKSWRVPRDTFHTTIHDFIQKLRFSDEYIKLFEASFLEVMKEKRDQSVQESEQAERSVADLLAEQKDTRESIKLTRNRLVIRDLESDYEILDERIKEARSLRKNKEEKELNYKSAIKHAVYLMEHLEELLIDEDNPMQQQQLFGLAFDEFPTYSQLVNGTPKLSLAFKLNQQQKLTKSEMVTPQGIEP